MNKLYVAISILLGLTFGMSGFLVYTGKPLPIMMGAFAIGLGLMGPAFIMGIIGIRDRGSHWTALRVVFMYYVVIYGYVMTQTPADWYLHTPDGLRLLAVHILNVLFTAAFMLQYLRKPVYLPTVMGPSLRWPFTSPTQK